MRDMSRGQWCQTFNSHFFPKCALPSLACMETETSRVLRSSPRPSLARLAVQEHDATEANRGKSLAWSGPQVVFCPAQCRSVLCVPRVSFQHVYPLFFFARDVEKRITSQEGQAVATSGPTRTRLTGLQTPGARGPSVAQSVREGTQEELERTRPRQRS